MKLKSIDISAYRFGCLEDLITLSDDYEFRDSLLRRTAAADPHEAIPVAHLLFALAFVNHELPRLIAEYFVEDALEPTAWSASECVVTGGMALQAMFDGQLGLIRSMEHDTQRLTVIDDYIAHELGWRRMKLRDGRELFARYAALWQYRKGQGWRVRQWLSAVDG